MLFASTTKGFLCLALVAGLANTAHAQQDMQWYCDDLFSPDGSTTPATGWGDFAVTGPGGGVVGGGVSGGFNAFYYFYTMDDCYAVFEVGDCVAAGTYAAITDKSAGDAKVCVPVAAEVTSKKGKKAKSSKSGKKAKSSKSSKSKSAKSKSSKSTKAPRKGRAAALEAKQAQAVRLEVGAGVALVGMVGFVALVATKLRASVVPGADAAHLLAATATAPLATAAEASLGMV